LASLRVAGELKLTVTPTTQQAVNMLRTEKVEGLPYRATGEYAGVE